MFAIFTLFAEQWSWYNFPHDLTESAYMILETSLLEQSSPPHTTTTQTGDVQDVSTSPIHGTTMNLRSGDTLMDNSDGDHGVDFEIDNGNTIIVSKDD